MAITSLQQLTDLTLASRRRAYRFTSTAGNTGTVNGQWTVASQVTHPMATGSTNGTGAIPTTGGGAVCDRNTQGGFFVPGAAPAAGNKLYIGRWLPYFGSGRTRIPILVDRLVTTSGLSGTSTAVQTVNTVALPRYTATTDRVEACLEWYVATGATATTATIVYLDENGVSRTSTMSIPASPAAGQMEMIPHVAGTQHRGISKVVSVQLAASTLTAGNFGVTLFKRHCHGRFRTTQDVMDWRLIGIPQVDYNACFQVLYPIDAAGGHTNGHEFTFIEA